MDPIVASIVTAVDAGAVSAFKDDATSLNNLSIRLSDSGDRAGALRAIEAAVEIYGRLAQAQPAAFEPDLARSLRLRDELMPVKRNPDRPSGLSGGSTNPTGR